MPKKLTIDQVRVTLKAHPWWPLVGVIERDNCEWAYVADPGISARSTARAFI